MNYSVTVLSETSVMSSSRFEISERSRSNGPLKLLKLSEKPTGADAASVASPAMTSSALATLGDGATDDQLSGHRAIRLGGGMIGGEGIQRCACD